MQIIDRVGLKDIEQKDLEIILQWRNQDRIRKVMFNSNIITREQHINWFNSRQQNDTTVSKMFYFDEKPYGILNVNHINRINKIGEWGFYIGDSTAPSGMGTILGYASLNYIFHELKLRKICGEVIESNNKSRIFHEKLGFKNDGILREHIFKENEYIDIYLYSLFNREWEIQSKKIKQKIEGRDL